MLRPDLAVIRKLVFEYVLLRTLKLYLRLLRICLQLCNYVSLLFTKKRVTICPWFSGTVPKIRLMSRNNFVPDSFSHRFIFPILFRLPCNIFRMENFLNLVSDFSDDEMATVLRSAQ
jgi:hypothetical protein